MDWEELLRRLRENVPCALEELNNHLFYSALALLRLRPRKAGTEQAAEDIAQQVVILLLGHVTTLLSGEHLRNWVHRVVRQRVADHCRNPRQRRAEELGDRGSELPGEATDPTAPAEQDDSLRQLRACVKLLPQPHRAVIELRLAGWTFQEIADLLGWAGPSGPKQSEMQAHELLRDCLDRKLGNDHGQP